jgi:glyoxylase-like metal-dependent hydrolase (beta-lactamase superfamily II)
VEEVVGGLWSIPVPIPNNPLRYVLVYAAELTGGGVALVDAGWPTDDAWEALQAGLKTAGIELTDVRSVLVTHLHPDHYGLAPRVREASGAWIGMHPADSALLARRYDTVDELLESQRRMMRESGIPAADLEEFSGASMGVKQFLEMKKPDVDIEDGQALDLPGWRFQAVWTPGHSPGHLCFFERDRRLFLSGDHVLPRITPNIGAHPQQPDNPLADFLDSLRKVSALDVDEVLPAHEYRFRNLGARTTALIEHHEERLREIEGALAVRPGDTTWELTLNLTWSRPWDQIPAYMRRAANGETLAHLLLLAREGRVRREGSEPAHWYLPIA